MDRDLPGVPATPSGSSGSNDEERTAGGKDERAAAAAAAAGPDDDDSPFEMVRAAVSNRDRPELPCLTFRAWVLGIVFCAGLAFVNQFFWFRENSIVLGGFVVQLLAFPLGYILALALPTRRFRTLGWSWTLNPGPFNIKEHAIISIFAGASAGTAYGIDVITIKRMWYRSGLGFWPSLLFLLTSQIMGYSFAGFARRFLVYPAAMVWPSTLVSVTLFRSFHEPHAPGGRFTRTQVFWALFAASFAWYFVPGVIFPALGFLSILCFAAPRNVIANQLGDAFNGVGMLNFSLDWSYISSAYTQSPIVTPWEYACNVFAGFVLVIWVIVPAGYYSNVWGTQTMPLYSASVYRANGSAYDIHQVMTAQSMLDETKYAQYGPLRMTFAFAIVYGLSFAALINLLVYIVLNHGAEIVRRVRQARTMDVDVHMRLMRAYRETPQWWYGATFVATFATAIVTCQVYNLLPWYLVILATVIPLVFTVPIGIIQALSNQQPGLNVITEFIAGYARPGDPIAVVTFKVYGYITMAQALSLVGDQKLGHYMKIPPRSLFIAQLVGTIIAAAVQLGVAFWLMDTVKNMCTPAGFPFTCIQANTFFSASVIWGLIGPARMFGASSPYHPMLYMFFVGLVLPLPIWMWKHRRPDSWAKHIHTPLLFIAAGYMPPAPSHVYTNWFIGCFFLNYLWHKYRNAQWTRYAFALSAGLDAGLAISGIVTYFAFQNVAIPSWWGTNTHHCPLAERGLAG